MIDNESYCSTSSSHNYFKTNFQRMKNKKTIFLFLVLNFYILCASSNLLKSSSTEKVVNLPKNGDFHVLPRKFSESIESDSDDSDDDDDK